jgi:hypothetical protein
MVPSNDSPDPAECVTTAQTQQNATTCNETPLLKRASVNADRCALRITVLSLLELAEVAFNSFSL